MADATQPPLKLYRHPLSGHCHRVELFLSLLGVPVQLCEVDLVRGAQKAPDFLALNAFGQVPVLDDAGTIVADSNAILVYLALKYDAERWWPRDPAAAAAVQRWLSVTAGPVVQGPGQARLINLFRLKQDPSEVIARAHGLLAVMEAELTSRPFLTGTAPSLADIAAYAYIAHAPEGGVSLADYPHVRAWLARVEALPAFVPMQRTPVGLSA
ncbi:MAG TPA: glutathione S-transferase family protein [Polyangiales bacterium]